jgi:hypothetical protein
MEWSESNTKHAPRFENELAQELVLLTLPFVKLSSVAFRLGKPFGGDDRLYIEEE